MGDDEGRQHIAGGVRRTCTLTMANCHVLRDYPLLAVPDQDRFVELVS